MSVNSKSHSTRGDKEIGYCPELPELLELPVYKKQAELAKVEFPISLLLIIINVPVVVHEQLNDVARRVVHLVLTAEERRQLQVVDLDQLLRASQRAEHLRARVEAEVRRRVVRRRLALRHQPLQCRNVSPVLPGVLRTLVPARLSWGNVKNLTGLP